jgi:hypothetical protein
MSCKFRAQCGLEQKLSVTLDVWRKAYCDSDRHEACARFRLASESLPIPVTLLPNGLRMGMQKR